MRGKKKAVSPSSAFEPLTGEMKPIPRLLADATSNRNILVRTCPEPLVSALKARFFPDTAISRSSGILVAKVPTLEGKLNTGVASAYDGTAVSFSLDRKAGSREQWAAQIFWIVLQPCASNEKIVEIMTLSMEKRCAGKMPSERQQSNGLFRSGRYARARPQKMRSAARLLRPTAQQLANTCRMSRRLEGVPVSQPWYFRLQRLKITFG